MIALFMLDVVLITVAFELYKISKELKSDRKKIK